MVKIVVVVVAVVALGEELDLACGVDTLWMTAVSKRGSAFVCAHVDVISQLALVQNHILIES